MSSGWTRHCSEYQQHQAETIGTHCCIGGINHHLEAFGVGRLVLTQCSSKFLVRVPIGCVVPFYNSDVSRHLNRCLLEGNCRCRYGISHFLWGARGHLVQGNKLGRTHICIYPHTVDVPTNIGRRLETIERRCTKMRLLFNHMLSWVKIDENGVDNDNMVKLEFVWAECNFKAHRSPLQYFVYSTLLLNHFCPFIDPFSNVSLLVFLRKSMRCTNGKVAEAYVNLSEFLLCIQGVGHSICEPYVYKE